MLSFKGVFPSQSTKSSYFCFASVFTFFGKKVGSLLSFSVGALVLLTPNKFKNFKLIPNKFKIILSELDNVGLEILNCAVI